jgi:hypothetical protein
VLVALGLALWAALATAARRRDNRLFVAIALGAALLLVCVDLWLGTRQLDYPRYALFGVPALVAALASLPGRAGVFVPCALAILLATRVPHACATERLPWRDFAPVFAAKARPHEPIVVVGQPGRDLNALAVFQALRHYAWAPDRGFVLVEGPADAALRDAVAARETAWVVSYRGARLSMLPPFRVEDELTYAPEMPRFFRVSFRP